MAAQAVKNGNKKSFPKTEETREKILKAAIQLFSKRGYRGTSVADIAEKAGVAKSAVFWYFGNKNGLVDMLTGKLVSESVQGMVREITSAQSADEADLVNSFLTHFQKKLEMDPILNRAYFLLTVESATEGEETEKPFIQALDAYHRFLTIIIKNGQKKGIFRIGWPPEEAARLISMLTMGAYVYWFRDPGRKPARLYKIIRRAIRDLLMVDTEKLPLGDKKEEE